MSLALALAHWQRAVDWCLWLLQKSLVATSRMRFRDGSVVQLEVRGEHLLFTLDYSMPCLCD